MTPGVLVASNLDDGGSVDDENTTPDSQPEQKKPSVSVDEQLNKALDLLKSKAA